MKRISDHRALMTLATLGMFAIGGCQPPRVPANVALSSSIGSFQVVAGVPSTNSGRVTFNNTSGLTVGNGTLEFKLDSITVSTGGPGKFVSLQPSTSILTITAHIAPPDDSLTVCTTGETYGPFDVTLDENLTPIASDPSTVLLSQDTIDLLNGGEFSLCIEVISPVTGNVTIDTLSFNLGL